MHKVSGYVGEPARTNARGHTKTDSLFECHQVAEHAGYQRAIINQNPPLIDEDGYDIDSDDNEERVQEAISATMEENPYASIRLEREWRQYVLVHVSRYANKS